MSVDPTSHKWYCVSLMVWNSCREGSFFFIPRRELCGREVLSNLSLVHGTKNPRLLGGKLMVRWYEGTMLRLKWLYQILTWPLFVPHSSILTQVLPYMAKWHPRVLSLIKVLLQGKVPQSSAGGSTKLSASGWRPCLAADGLSGLCLGFLFCCCLPDWALVCAAFEAEPFLPCFRHGLTGAF